MLDSIVDQLEVGQKCGIWAYNCVLKEKVMVIPSVLALLGDNPMQSEMACHMGLNGNLPCCICLVRSNLVKKSKESVKNSGQSSTVLLESSQQICEDNDIYDSFNSDDDNVQSDDSAASLAGVGEMTKRSKKRS